MSVDVAMPTKNSSHVIGETLAALETAFDNSELEPGRLLVDDASEDGTPRQIRTLAGGMDFDLAVEQTGHSLPTARRALIDRVETDWFLFLDDDVRLTPDYLWEVESYTSVRHLGAVQGRKRSRADEHPTDWHRRRARRAGTHATLLRREAVAGAPLPDDVVVLEDEYLRRVVEGRGYQWLQHSEALFRHECQDRHPIGWREGVVAGRYGLATGHRLALNVPFAVATGRNPWPHLKRAAGWLYGRATGAGDVEPVASAPEA